MTATVTPETFYKSLQDAMRARIEEALAAEIEAACDKLRARLRAEAATIALSMMSYYNAYQRGDHLVIEVRNAASDKP